MNEEKLSKKCNDFYAEGLEGNRQWRDRAKEDFKFYWGDQWEDADKKMLQAAKKPALTFNRILPAINVLAGIERQNREMVRIYARKGGTDKVAQALTEIVKHLYDTSNGHYEESMQFLDGLICGKGWIALDVDYQYDPINGDLVIERESPFRIIEDPQSNSYDLNKDGRYIIRTYWWTKDEITLNYPDKKKDIESGYLGKLVTDDTSEETMEEQINQTVSDVYQNVTGAVERKRYRVREVYWREWKRKTLLINKLNLEVTEINKKSEKDIRALKEKLGGTEFEKEFDVVDRVLPTLHKTVIVGDLVLESEEDPFHGFTQFPFVRFCPFWLDGVVFGHVHNLKDPQKEHNKRISQVLHLLNQAPNTGWLGEQGWYAGDKEELEQYGSKPGVNIEFRKGKKPERLQPSQVSNGHFLLAENGKQAIPEISGANADLMGHDKTKAESGIAMQLRMRQGLAVNEIVFDNFSYTRQILSQNLVEIIRESTLYSEEEIDSILHERLEDVSLKDIQNFRYGRYGVKIEKNPNSPTVRMANFSMLLEAAKAGLPIPPEDLIELSDLPNKESILQHMKEQREAEAAVLQGGGMPPPTGPQQRPPGPPRSPQPAPGGQPPV